MTFSTPLLAGLLIASDTTSGYYEILTTGGVWSTASALTAGMVITASGMFAGSQVAVSNTTVTGPDPIHISGIVSDSSLILGIL